VKFPYPKSALVSLLSLFFLSGCAHSEVFSPPVNGENLHFSATVPSELEALPISAMYRSEICRKERRTANMKSNTVPGFHRATYTLSTGQLNEVKANIPKSGGGKCDWKLSNITFEVKLKDPSKIDPLITENFGMEATFVLDNNAPATFDGGYEKKSGDLNETLTLFPLIIESFIGGHEKSFWLIAKYETMTYKVKNTKNINVNVDYKSDIKTYRIGIKKKDNNEIATFIYSNGEKEKTKWLFPEYKKLVEISESMSHK